MPVFELLAYVSAVGRYFMPSNPLPLMFDQGSIETGGGHYQIKQLTALLFGVNTNLHRLRWAGTRKSELTPPQFSQKVDLAN